MPRAITPKALDKAPSNGARELTGEFDVLKQPMPPLPITYTRARIGIHTSTSGGVERAVERAYRLGCNAMQIFSSSPRMWRASSPAISQCIEFYRLAVEYDIDPVVIHTSYLVNMCSKTPEFLEKSVAAFRGEVQRALALSAKYLVLHPGSFSGGTREEGLQCATDSIARAVDGIDLSGKDFKILIENTAGAEYSLGGSFDQVAELLRRLRKVVPVAACIDTCHTHVAGYDVVSAEGFADTMQQIEKTIKLENVPVWHCNDAKAARGSKLDRHANIGQGTIGIETFRRLINDPRTRDAAFIAETPVDEPGDDRKNVDALKAVVQQYFSSSTRCDRFSMRKHIMPAALRATKSFSLEKEVLKAVEKSKGPKSTSERVNDLLKMGLEMERRRELDQEAADFFNGAVDTAERRAFRSASIKSWAREDK